jgi:hypothetical protein
MASKKGCFVLRKGKFFWVQLVMSHSNEPGGKEYYIPYGQYINEKEARKICQRQNRFALCLDCQWKKKAICQI